MSSGLISPAIDARHAPPATKALARFLQAVGLQPILCVVAVLACIAIAQPFANSAFDDDWSYSDVALKFAQTGHFRYNGWGSPTILFQTVWGAAWIRLFGFSFDLLRIASIPFSLGFVLLVYALGRRAGLSKGLATFSALIVGTSPLFLTLAASFMTDIYGCFFITGCAYAAIACIEESRLSTAIRWLWVVALSGIAGGSNRQLVWVAPLLLIPYLGWKRRSNRRFAAHAMAAGALCVSCLGIVLAGFSQPYAPLELSHKQLSALFLDGWFVGLAFTFGNVLSGLLVAMPALLYLSPLWKRLTIWEGVKCCLMAAAGTAILPRIFGASDGLAPFLGNMLTPVGILKPGQDALGFRPILLPELLRIALTWLLLFSVGAFGYMYSRVRKVTDRGPWQVFALITCPYLVLLIPGAMLILVYDRYMLPLLPLFVIFILRKFQSLVPTVPWMAWICLMLFAAYGIATTHDYFGGLRARAAAAQALEANGIPRNRISAGFEYDGWTQLQTSGTIQIIHYDERIAWNTTDKFGFWAKTPAITPDFVATYWPASTLPANRLASIPFDTWFPPFHRAVVVLKHSDLPKGEVNSHAE